MKKIYSILTILLICSVIGVSAALIEHYGLFQVELGVTNPLSSEGNLIQEISILSGQGIFGDKITISNIADWDIDVQVTADNIEEEISVRYCSSENIMDMIDFMSNDITLTLNNESIDIYPYYFANPLLESGNYIITNEVNQIV